jgi:peroxiredoxin family protein
MQQKQKMMDVEQNELLKEYVDSAAGFTTTMEEAKEFIEMIFDSDIGFYDDLKMA